MVSKPNDSFEKVANFFTQFDPDKDLFITVSDDKAKIRSNAQNALIHVYYAAISEKTGYEVDDCEARCKRQIWPTHHASSKGRIN